MNAPPRTIPALFPTTVVGSLPQPEWLIDRAEARGPLPAAHPREGAVAHPRALARAGAGRRDDRRDPRAGGSRPRHRHRRRDPPRKLLEPVLRPRSTASTSSTTARRSIAAAIRIRCRASSVRSGAAMPSSVSDLEFLRRHTTRPVKITVPGPFTMSQQAQNDHYGGSRELAAMDYAVAVNAEIRDLFAAGADIVQIDEPYMQARPDKARAYGLAGAQPRTRGRSRARPPCTSASAMRRSSTTRPFRLLVPAGARRTAAASRSRSRPRSRTSTARCSPGCAARRSCSGSSTSARRKSRRRKRSRHGSGARCRTWPRKTSSSRRIAG